MATFDLSWKKLESVRKCFLLFVAQLATLNRRAPGTVKCLIVSKKPTIGFMLGTEGNIARVHPMGIATLSTKSFGAAIGSTNHRTDRSTRQENTGENTKEAVGNTLPAK